MIALDVSVLAYAINRFAPEHARASRLVEELIQGERPWALPWPAVHEFLRLVTHPDAVARPLGSSEAVQFVERVLEAPSVMVLGPTVGHARALAEVLDTVPTAGGLPTGLEVAATLHEHGLRELLSADRGMRRYPFLTVIDPVHGEPWSPGARPARRYRMLRHR
jgi:toxin-antitoxin system PIN domain toxin